MATQADFFIAGNTFSLEPTLAETAGAYMYQVKELLKSAGWTGEYSANGLTLFTTTGDIITTPEIMNVDNAWVRIVSPDSMHEYIFQMVVSGINNRCRVVWNGGNGSTFTNGGSPTQHPELVGGTEIVLVGFGGTASAPSTTGNAFWWGDTGATEPGMVAYGVAETVAPYRFWATANRPGSPYHKTGNILLDHVAVSPQGDTNYVSFCSFSTNSGWDDEALENDTSTAGSAWALSGGVARRLVLTDQNNLSLQIPANPDGFTFTGPVFWIQGDDQAGSIGLFGASTMLNRAIQPAVGNFNQRTQINTNLGALSHILANEYTLPWPSMTQFTHFQNPWDVVNKLVFEAVPADPASLSGGGTPAAGPDTTGPVIQNLVPENLGNLINQDFITFEAVDMDSQVNKVLIFVKFEGDVHTELVFDGDSFSSPYAALSSVDETDVSTHKFSVRPTGGWSRDVEGFTVRIADIWGNFDEEDGGPGGGVGN